ncbi:hypothetical protein HA402_003379 [Bradysia odoriphaga]|nr:hypothetical protein HA402_003379 [Bradysia odoriphaga]
MNLFILLICFLICVGCLYAATVVKQKILSDTDLATSETVFVGPVGALLTTLGLTYFYRSLGFQPYDRDPLNRYYRNRYDSDSSSSDEETAQELHDRLFN